jgi:hypothetical protein
MPSGLVLPSTFKDIRAP